MPVAASVAAAAGLDNLAMPKSSSLTRPLWPDHHIVGLEIAVNDARVMRFDQRRRNLDPNLQRRREVRGRAAGKLAQRHAVDELVGDEGRACGLADVVDGNDVRMIQGRCGFRLANEAMQPVAIGGQLGRKDLQRDAAVEAGILREIHLPHPAFAERGDDLVMP